MPEVAAAEPPPEMQAQVAPRAMRPAPMRRETAPIAVRPAVARVQVGPLASIPVPEGPFPRTVESDLIRLSAETFSALDTDPRDTLIEVFDATTFAHDKTVTLPQFQRQASPLLMHGQFVFDRSDGTTYYVVPKSEPIDGVEKDRAFGVVRLAP
jgi:hypothetical protein